MLKDLKDIIRKDDLLDGVYLPEYGEDAIYGRGSDIIEQAKHAIIISTVENEVWEDAKNEITMLSDLIEEIESESHTDDYLKVAYNPMGAFEISDAMGEQ